MADRGPNRRATGTAQLRRIQLPGKASIYLIVWGCGGGLLSPGPPLQAQEVPVPEAVEVEARSTEGFTRVLGARELSDGRVVLVDYHERLVRILSPDLSDVATVGRHGQGPGEYRLPGDLFALEGDSSAVYDGARPGFVLLRPDGITEHIPRPEASAAVGRARWMDRSGALYAPGAPTRGADSVPLLRRRVDSPSWDTVMMRPAPSERSVPASDRIPFSPQTIWTIGEDGWIAIVTPDPYRVELIDPDGVRRTGPAVAYDPIPVSEAHKETWREQRAHPQPGIGVVFGEEGTQVRMVVLPTWEPQEWPEFLPPFLGGALRFAPDGTLWVERAIHVRDPPLFDVFDREGMLVRRVHLPAGSRLVGFGEGSLLVVTKDAFDLEYLQRIRVR